MLDGVCSPLAARRFVFAWYSLCILILSPFSFTFYIDPPPIFKDVVKWLQATVGHSFPSWMTYHAALSPDADVFYNHQTQEERFSENCSIDGHWWQKRCFLAVTKR